MATQALLVCVTISRFLVVRNFEYRMDVGGHGNDTRIFFRQESVRTNLVTFHLVGFQSLNRHLFYVRSQLSDAQVYHMLRAKVQRYSRRLTKVHDRVSLVLPLPDHKWLFPSRN